MSRRMLISTTATAGALALAVVLFYPRSPDAAFNQTLQALDRGDASGMISTVQMLQRRRGYSDHVRLLDGVFFLRAGRTDAALSRLFPVPSKGPLRPQFLMYGAQSLHGAGRLVEAEILLRNLVQIDPNHEDARRWLGIVYYDLGANDAAIHELQQLTKLAPEDFRPHRLIGLMYRDFERYTEAVDHYRLALDRSPPPDIRNAILQEMGQALVAMRQFDEARETVRQAEPTGLTYLILAQCDWNQGKAAEARRHLATSRELDATIPEVSLMEAEILVSEKNAAEALAVLRAAAERHPHHAQVHYHLALVLRDLGESTEAEAAMTRWRAENELATQLTELNVKALRDPHDAAVRDQLAEVCTALGKTELAEMWRRAAKACRAPAPLR